jgi:hypothetical protein
MKCESISRQTLVEIIIFYFVDLFYVQPKSFHYFKSQSMCVIYKGDTYTGLDWT